MNERKAMRTGSHCDPDVRSRACWHSTLPPDNRRLPALDVKSKAQEANYPDASGTASR
jgi:hypothetical protein